MSVLPMGEKRRVSKWQRRARHTASCWEWEGVAFYGRIAFAAFAINGNEMTDGLDSL